MASVPSCLRCSTITQGIYDIDFLPDRRMFKDNRNILIRQHAVSMMAKLAKMYNPRDAHVPYVAMNFFDRILCDYDTMPAEGLTAAKKVHLIALSCFTLSGTKRKYSFKITDLLTALHSDMDLNWISHDAVMTMQHHITEKLKNKLKPMTAFWFLDHFYSHFEPLGIKLRSIHEIIVQAQGEHTFVDDMHIDIAFSACVAAATIALGELPEDISNMIRNNVISVRVTDVLKKLLELCDRMNILIDKIEVAAEENEGKGKGKAVIQEDMMDAAAIRMSVPTERMMNFELKWATDVPPLEEDIVVPVTPLEHAEPRESTGCCTCI